MDLQRERLQESLECLRRWALKDRAHGRKLIELDIFPANRVRKFRPGEMPDVGAGYTLHTQANDPGASGEILLQLTPGLEKRTKAAELLILSRRIM